MKYGLALMILIFFGVNGLAAEKRFSQTVPCNIIDEGPVACYTKAIGLQQIELSKLLLSLKQKSATQENDSFVKLGIKAIEGQMNSLKLYCGSVGQVKSSTAAISYQGTLKNLEYLNRSQYEPLICECDALDDLIAAARILNSAK